MMIFTLIPPEGSRKLVGFYYAVVMYVLGCLATGVKVDSYTFVALFGLFMGANYGEWKTKNGK